MVVNTDERLPHPVSNLDLPSVLQWGEMLAEMEEQDVRMLRDEPVRIKREACTHLYGKISQHVGDKAVRETVVALVTLDASESRVLEEARRLQAKRLY